MPAKVKAGDGVRPCWRLQGLGTQLAPLPASTCKSDGWASCNERMQDIGLQVGFMRRLQLEVTLPSIEVPQELV